MSAATVSITTSETAETTGAWPPPRDVARSAAIRRAAATIAGRPASPPRDPSPAALEPDDRGTGRLVEPFGHPKHRRGPAERRDATRGDRLGDSSHRAIGRGLRQSQVSLGRRQVIGQAGQADRLDHGTASGWDRVDQLPVFAWHRHPRVIPPRRALGGPQGQLVMDQEHHESLVIAARAPIQLRERVPDRLAHPVGPPLVKPGHGDPLEAGGDLLDRHSVR